MDEKEVKAMAKKHGFSEDYVRSVLEWKEREEAREREVAPMAEALGMTPIEYISMMEQHQSNLAFFEAKGFDTKTTEGLEEIQKWLQTASPDELMLGEPTGSRFDIMMGSARRGMLLKTVRHALRMKKAN